MASSAKSGLADSICLAKQADLEAVAFSGTGRRLARAANGLGLGIGVGWRKRLWDGVRVEGSITFFRAWGFGFQD